MNAVFLSASIPDPRRDPKYHGSADVVAIREAVRALAAAVLPRAPLVFGGHPAITPLVRHVAERVGGADRVTVYQSGFFRRAFPVDNAFFPDVVVVPMGPDEDASLLRMRTQMLLSREFAAGVFIGGMEGVEREFELFRSLCPHARWLPVGSAGAGGRELLRAHGSALGTVELAQLGAELVYGPMFERLLGYSARAGPTPTSRGRPGSG